MQSPNPSQYGPTELRGVLSSLLNLHELSKPLPGPLLSDWQLRVARLRVSQAHYTTYEAKQIFRIVLEHHRSGALAAALARRDEANSPENHMRIGKCINSHAGYVGTKSGNFWCVICNSGSNVYYHIGKGRLAGMCQRRDCIRIFSPDIEFEQRRPKFANIIPQDIGTFLIESMDPRNLGNYYGVDAIEQTCTCDDYKYRSSDGHLCKHLLEVNYAVYVARAF